MPNYDAYKASKAGVMEFARNANVVSQVPIACVRPGFVATGIHNATLDAGWDRAGSEYGLVMQKLEHGGRPMAQVVEEIFGFLGAR